MVEKSAGALKNVNILIMFSYKNALFFHTKMVAKAIKWL